MVCVLLVTDKARRDRPVCRGRAGSVTEELSGEVGSMFTV